MMKVKANRAGLVPIKKKVKGGALIAFWVRPEKAGKQHKAISPHIFRQKLEHIETIIRQYGAGGLTQEEIGMSLGEVQRSMEQRRKELGELRAELKASLSATVASAKDMDDVRKYVVDALGHDDSDIINMKLAKIYGDELSFGKKTTDRLSGLYRDVIKRDVGKLNTIQQLIDYAAVDVARRALLHSIYGGMNIVLHKVRSFGNDAVRSYLKDESTQRERFGRLLQIGMSDKEITAHMASIVVDIDIRAPRDRFYEKAIALKEGGFNAIVSKRFKDKYGIEVRGFPKERGYDVMYVEELLDALPEKMTKGNGMFNKLEYRKHSDKDKGAMALYNKFHRRVTILDIAKEYGRAFFKLGDFNSTYAGCIYHEIAHSLQHKLVRGWKLTNRGETGGDAFEGWTYDGESKDMMDGWARVCGWDGYWSGNAIYGYDGKQRYRELGNAELVSDYAATSPDEAFSETFAVYWTQKESIDSTLDAIDEAKKKGEDLSLQALDITTYRDEVITLDDPNLQAQFRYMRDVIMEHPFMKALFGWLGLLKAKVFKRAGLVPVKKQVRTKKGTSTIAYWVKPGRAKPEEERKVEDITDTVPVRDLNRGVDFKANYDFLMKEIEGADIQNIMQQRQYIELYEDDIRDFKTILSSKASIKAYARKMEAGIRVDRPLDQTLINYWKHNAEQSLESAERGLAESKKELADMTAVAGGLSEYEIFVKNLTPVHSLDIDKFVKVLKAGGLKSLEELGESGKNLAYATIESEIRPKFGDEVSKLIYDVIKWHGVVDFGDFPKPQFKNMWDLVEKSEYRGEFAGIIGKMVKADMEQKAGAIAYAVDKGLGTNKHVFSILGPNGNGSGYGEISIVLKQDIVHHPDFNMTPVAGTSFYSGNVYEKRGWTGKSILDVEYEEMSVQLRKVQNELDTTAAEFNRKRPMSSRQHIRKMQELVNRDNLLEMLSKRDVGHERTLHFHKSKLNAKENPTYWRYMAKDIAAQGSMDDYLIRQSHGKWEAHLPAFVPTSQFAEIIMSKDTLSNLRKSIGSWVLDTELYKSRWAKALGMTDDVKAEKILSPLREEIKNEVDKKLYAINIKTVDTQDDILPYMNEGFKKGKWRNKALTKAFIPTPIDNKGKVNLRKVPQGATIWITKDGNAIPLTRFGNRFAVDFKAARDAGYEYEGARELAHTTFELEGGELKPVGKKDKETLRKERERRDKKDAKKAYKREIKKELRTRVKTAMKDMLKFVGKEKEKYDGIRKDVESQIRRYRMSDDDRKTYVDTVVNEVVKRDVAKKLEDAKRIASGYHTKTVTQSINLIEPKGVKDKYDLINRVKEGFDEKGATAIAVGLGIAARAKAILDKGALQQKVGALETAEAQRLAFERKSARKTMQEIEEIYKVGIDRLKLMPEDVEASQKLFKKNYNNTAVKSIYAIMGKDWTENVGAQTQYLADKVAARQINALLGQYLDEQIDTTRMMKAIGIGKTIQLVAGYLKETINPSRYKSFYGKVRSYFTDEQVRIDQNAMDRIKELRRSLKKTRTLTTRGAVYDREAENLVTSNLIQQRNVIASAYGQLHGMGEFVKALGRADKFDKVEVELSRDENQARAEYRRFTYYKDRKNVQLKVSAFGNKMVVKPASLREYYIKETLLDKDAIKQMNKIKHSRAGVRKDAHGNEYVAYDVHGMKKDTGWRWRASQRNDIEFLNANGGKGIISRTVGGGKTMTAVGFHAENLKNNPIYGTIMAVPDGHVGQQFAEIEKWTDLKAVRVPSGLTPEQTDRFIRRNSGKGAIWVISHSTLANHYEALSGKRFNNLTIDEPHEVFFDNSGRMTEKGRNVANRLKGVEHKVALTATPLSDNPADVYNLLNWVDPENVGSRTNFRAKFGDRERYEIDGKIKEEELSFTDMSLGKHNLVSDLFREHIDKYVSNDIDLHRTYEVHRQRQMAKPTTEIYKELRKQVAKAKRGLAAYIKNTPISVKQSYPKTWKQKQAQKYTDRVVREQIRAINTIGGNDNPKTKALIRNIDKKMGEKHVVYVDGKAHADSVTKALVASGYPADQIYSLVGRRQAGTESQKAEWTDSKKPAILFISARETSGHNLQAANTLHKVGTVLSGQKEIQVDGRVPRGMRDDDATLIEYSYGTVYEDSIRDRINEYKAMLATIDQSQAKEMEVESNG